MTISTGEERSVGDVGCEGWGGEEEKVVAEGDPTLHALSPIRVPGPITDWEPKLTSQSPDRRSAYLALSKHKTFS